MQTSLCSNADTAKQYVEPAKGKFFDAGPKSWVVQPSQRGVVGVIRVTTVEKHQKYINVVQTCRKFNQK